MVHHSILCSRVISGGRTACSLLLMLHNKGHASNGVHVKLDVLLCHGTKHKLKSGVVPLGKCVILVFLQRPFLAVGQTRVYCHARFLDRCCVNSGVWVIQRHIKYASRVS